MRHREPLQRPLLIGFVTIAVLAIVTSLVAFLAGRQLATDQASELAHRADDLLEARHLNATLLEHTLRLRSYLQSGDETVLERSEQARSRARNLIGHMRAHEGPLGEAALIARIDSLETAHAAIATRTIERVRTHDDVRAYELQEEAQPLREALTQQVLRLEQAREQRFRAARVQSERANADALRLVSTLGGIGALSLAIVALLMNATLTRVYQHERRQREEADAARAAIETLNTGLRAGEERLRIAAEAASLGVFEWDVRSGRVVYENARMYQIFGLDPGDPPYSREDLFEHVIHPEDRALMGAEMDDAVRTASPLHMAFRIRRRDGEWRWVELTGRFELRIDRSPRRLIGVMNDITERHQLEQDLVASRQELEERVKHRTRELEQSLSSITSFAHAVSHDLRAPLRAMRGYAEALAEDFGSQAGPTARMYVARIQDATARMNQLTQDLLDLGRVSHREMPLGPVDVEEAVRGALEQLEADLQASRASIETDFSSTGVVIAHGPTLVQALANLVSNAIKFVGRDRTPQIRIWSERAGDRVRVHVQDNGIGIAAEHQERIFQLFERLHRNDAYPGTGIGLTMVRQSLDRMGGSVSVFSRPGEGSRFTLELAAAEEPLPAPSGDRRAEHLTRA